jgi:hypothetical protein
MITGIKKTEAQYRAVDMDSSSSLKDFSLDRKKYYKKYIKGEKVEEKDTQAATMGRLVETLLMEAELFDERFYMSSLANAPTGLMLSFVESLYKFTELATEDGILTRSFEDIAKDAYAESGFKIKFETVLSKFSGSDAEIYFNELSQVKSKGLTVVTADDVNNAEKIIDELRTNDVTCNIVNIVNSARYEVFNQFQIEGYEIDGLKLKSMLDKVIIDHQEKKVYIYDLKCVWAVENFYEEYYLYRRAYIQAFLYHRAVISTTEFQDYEVMPTRFIVCDSTNYYNPLVYTLSVNDLDECYNGFEHKGRTYRGVKSIISDLKWAVENDKWGISRENFSKNGILNIKD